MNRRQFEDRMTLCGLVAIAGIDRGLARQAALTEAACIFVPEDAIDGEFVYPDRIPEGDRLFASMAPSFALAWAECGFPRVEISQRLAAAFMATSMPDDLVDGLELPWRCFEVSVPAGLVDNDEHAVVILKNHGGLIAIFGVLATGLWVGFEPQLSGLAEKLIPRGASPGLTSEDGHPRKQELIMRLVLGVIAELNGRQPSTRMGRGDVVKAVASGDRSQVRPRTFKLTRNVSVDAREEIAKYARGDRTCAATVRSLIRGHWKLQPHGVGRTLRRMVHIEPYWRGDESLPIAVRSHVIDGGGR